MTAAVFLFTALLQAPPAVCFSPRGGCTDSLVQAIDRVRKDSILVQAYNFTSAPIAQALVRARARGCTPIVLVDAKAADQRGGQAAFLDSAGVQVFEDGKHAIAHDKVMVLGRAMTATGSFNFTGAAEFSNAENLVLLQGKATAELYRANWYRHRAHAIKYRRPDSTP